MEKRNYIKPSCEVVSLNSTQSLLAGSNLTMDTGNVDDGPQLVGKKRNNQIVDAWSWEAVLWNQQESENEEE